MTTPAPINPAPISVDYTNRDFYSLREALISRVQSRVPDWSGTDPSDFGLALIEAFAYMGDVLGYYADRVANETNILTATQRSSVLSLARTYGYNPAGYQAATISMDLKNSSEEDIVVPAGTQFSGSVTVGDTVKQLVFTTSIDKLVPAQVDTTPGSATVTATHGEAVSERTSPASIYSSAGELVGYSDGTTNQSFSVKENQVVDGSLAVYVKSGEAYTQWTNVLHLSDYGPNDAVYTSSTDAENYVTITFGDGISGAIPPMHFEIRAKYNVGGGIAGNVPARTYLAFKLAPSGTPTSVSTNIASAITADSGSAEGVGGVDPEDLDSIRFSAIKAYSTMNRAVTTADYASLALTAKGCGKANAVADVWSSVTVYAAPSRDLNSTETFPLFEGTSTVGNLNLIEWVPFQADVAGTLQNKTQVGVSVSIAPPKYVPVEITIKYTKLPGFTDDQIQADIKNYMQVYYNYLYRSFDEVIRPEQIEFLLRYVSGIENVRVVYLNRVGESAARTTLNGAPNEIFIFNSVDGSSISRTTVTAYSEDSTLSALTISQTGGSVVTALSPTFTTSFYNYVYAVSSASTSVTVTPTATTGTSAVITVNGTVVASGATSGAITLGASGTTTTATIAVTAEDGVTTSTYTIAVSRA